MRIKAVRRVDMRRGQPEHHLRTGMRTRPYAIAVAVTIGACTSTTVYNVIGTPGPDAGDAMLVVSDATADRDGDAASADVSQEPRLADDGNASTDTEEGSADVVAPIDTGDHTDTAKPTTDAGCSPPPKGLPCDPGNVQCGGPCSVPANLCCGEQNDSGVASLACVTSTSTCPGLKQECDGSEDCPNGKVCCLVASSTMASGVTISCQPSCSGGIFATQVCKSDSECPAGPCIPQTCALGSLTMVIESCMAIPAVCTPL